MTRVSLVKESLPLITVIFMLLICYYDFIGHFDENDAFQNENIYKILSDWTDFLALGLFIIRHTNM